MGIKHVYDSRSIEFAEQIRRDTDGYGVDIVLNSFTGAAQRAGIELLAFGGRFVEIGKRDIYGDTRLGLFPFRRNLTFYYCRPGDAVDQPPPTRRGAAAHCVPASTWTGNCLPRSTPHYPLVEAATAIRVMSAAEHTGKLVLDVPQAGSRSVRYYHRSRLRFSVATAPTSITGGLGRRLGSSSPRRWPRRAAGASC